MVIIGRPHTLWLDGKAQALESSIQIVLPVLTLPLSGSLPLGGLSGLFSLRSHLCKMTVASSVLLSGFEGFVKPCLESICSGQALHSEVRALQEFVRWEQ